MFARPVNVSDSRNSMKLKDKSLLVAQSGQRVLWCSRSSRCVRSENTRDGMCVIKLYFRFVGEMCVDVLDGVLLVL